jgi:hypothetical protein
MSEQDDPSVACEGATEDESDDDRDVPDEEDPAPEEAGYGYGV